MAFQLPDLPYATNALEPHIDEQTMQIHHGKHHNTYVTNLNNAVAGTEFENMDVDELMRNLDNVPEDKRTAVRNNGGGHANHSLFWKLMAPNAGGAPSGDVASGIEQAGKRHFGIGVHIQPEMPYVHFAGRQQGWLEWLQCRSGGHRSPLITASSRDAILRCKADMASPVKK